MIGATAQTAAGSLWRETGRDVFMLLPLMPFPEIVGLFVHLSTTKNTDSFLSSSVSLYTI